MGAIAIVSRIPLSTLHVCLVCCTVRSYCTYLYSNIVLFNSVEFLLLFLPATLALFFWVNRGKYARYSVMMLVAASLFFYGWWDVRYVALLVTSITLNWGVGCLLTIRPNRGMLFAAITANLAVLGYFKYFNFFIGALTGEVASIVLPLGISFFTFTQIAYLVDASRGEVKETNFASYALFVTFFPHLIAGPLLHHKEMIAQFDVMKGRRPTSEMVGHGLFLLIVGLFKKVVIADSLARYVEPIYGHVATIEIVDAWTATIGYALQLYFDFSAYSEMAMGAALLFGVRLPVNFNSPYRAASISEFWTRWHITLSRFLKDYLYIPLGGNRHGQARMYAALFITMLLGGLWHGAGMQFLIWGGMHGVFLVIHKAWHKTGRAMGEGAGRFLTFTSVLLAWVMFRAASVSDAVQIWKKMFGLDGVVVPIAYQGLVDYLPGLKVAMSPAINGLELLWMLPLVVFCMEARNVHEALAAGVPSWRKTAAVGGMAFIALFCINTPSSFQYFQF